MPIILLFILAGSGNDEDILVFPPLGCHHGFFLSMPQRCLPGRKCTNDHLSVMDLTKKMNTQIMGTEHATIVEIVLEHKYAVNTIIVIMVIVNSTKTVNTPKKISTENPPSTSNASRDVLMTLAAQMVILAFSDAVQLTFGGSKRMENKFIWLNFLK